MTPVAMQGQYRLPDPPPALLWRPDEPTDVDAEAVLVVLRQQDRVYLKGELTARTGLDERTVRAAIETLRRLGWPVCSSSGRPGYRLTWDRERLDELERDLSSRALAILRTRRLVRRARQLRAA